MHQKEKDRSKSRLCKQALRVAQRIAMSIVQHAKPLEPFLFKTSKIKHKTIQKQALFR